MLLKTATLGCKVNQYETQFVREALERIGYSDAAPGESADLVIVNTCTVTAESDQKSRKLIRRLAKLNPQAEIVVMGCYATRVQGIGNRAVSLAGVPAGIGNQKPYPLSPLEKSPWEKFPQVTEVITDKRDIPAFLERRGVIDVPDGIASFEGSSLAATRNSGSSLAATRNSGSSLAATRNSGSSTAATRSSLRHRAYVKVQDGCRVGCAYCIIPKVRPYLWSRPVGEVLDEIRRLVDSGYREIVLVGIHLGHYGLDELQVAARLLPFERDFYTQTEQKPLIAGNVRKGSSGAATCNLSQLVERIMQLDGPFRLRVSSMEAVEVSDELIDLMRAFPKKLCPHLHLSMQSGSDEVLRRMRRRWPSGPFRERCEQIKDAIDRVALTTDVIAGFPGETENQFAETCDMVERIGFSKVHVFPFSPREGTEAATMPNQIPAMEKERRVTHLMQLADRLRANFAAGQIGQTVQVLFETQQNSTLIGTSDRYLRTRVQMDSAITKDGGLVDLMVTASEGDEIIANFDYSK